jgi:hypothetical protein
LGVVVPDTSLPTSILEAMAFPSSVRADVHGVFERVGDSCAGIMKRRPLVVGLV